LGSVAPAIQTAAIAAAGGAGLVAAALAALWAFTDSGRWWLGRLLPIGALFTRITRRQALEHPTREQIHDYVRLNPGRSINDIRHGLDLSRSTLVHHLRVLKMQRLLRIRREGYRAHVEPVAPPHLPVPYATPQQARILEAVNRRPGISQKELAAAVGMDRKQLAYHTNALERAGRLQIRRNGRSLRHHPGQEGKAQGPS
jgi:predicted transcriptional regulator